MFEKSLDFGREKESFPQLRIIKGLNSVAVPGQKQALGAFVPNREGKHAVKFPHTIGAPLLIGIEYDFGVRLGMELIPSSFQLDPQLLKIVDLAVIADNDVVATARHGLMTLRR